MNKAATTTSHKRYAGQDHDVRVAERRIRFIEAGLVQFGTIGYHATTVRSLCAEAELTARYYYESFDSIEALLIACYQHLMGQFREHLINALKGAEPGAEDLVRAGLGCFFEAVLNPVFARITMVEVIGVSPQVDMTHMRNTQAFGNLMMDALMPDEAKAHSLAANLEVLGYSLAGSLTFAAIYWMKGGYKVPMDQMVG
ncbi:MAG: TetR/AcrR family transcriptional regulator, partial [Gammaproteobacteria bacterium]